jgi:hypothetical protein
MASRRIVTDSRQPDAPRVLCYRLPVLGLVGIAQQLLGGAGDLPD